MYHISAVSGFVVKQKIGLVGPSVWLFRDSETVKMNQEEAEAMAQHYTDLYHMLQFKLARITREVVLSETEAQTVQAILDEMIAVKRRLARAVLE